MAGAGEILVTAAVPLAVTGTQHEFVARGRKVLKGVPGEWDLFSYAVEADRVKSRHRPGAQ